MQVPLSGLLNLTLPLNLPSFWGSPNPLGGGVVPLSPEQFDEFVPYMEFARAAYCEPEIITGWQCGGQFFFSPTPFLLPLPPSTRLLIGPKALAVPFQTSNQRWQVETATVPNTVSVAALLGFRVLSTSSDLTHDDRLCRVLAYPVGRGSGTRRHRPIAFVCQLSLVFLRQRLVTRSLSVLTDLEIAFMKPDPGLFPKIPNDVVVHSGFAIEHKKTASLILKEVKDLMAKHSSTHVILVRLHRS